jgi:hypothetical protein
MTLGRPLIYPDDAEPLIKRSAVYRARTWSALVELSHLKRTSISAELRAQLDDARILAEIARITEKDDPDDENTSESPLTT